MERMFWGVETSTRVYKGQGVRRALPHAFSRYTEACHTEDNHSTAATGRKLSVIQLKTRQSHLLEEIMKRLEPIADTKGEIQSRHQLKLPYVLHERGKRGDNVGSWVCQHFRA
jgi:hypothetical protein